MFRKAIAAVSAARWHSRRSSRPPRSGSGPACLSCDVSGGIGFIIGSQRRLSCLFTPDGGGPQEIYHGTISRFGLDIGATAGGIMVWAVFSEFVGPRPGFAGRRLCRRHRRGDHRGRARRQCAGRRLEPHGRAAAALGQRPGRAQSRGRRRRSAAAARPLITTATCHAMQRPPYRAAVCHCRHGVGSRLAPAGRRRAQTPGSAPPRRAPRSGPTAPKWPAGMLRDQHDAGVVGLHRPQLGDPLGRLPVLDARVADAGGHQHVRIGLGLDVVIGRVAGDGAIGARRRWIGSPHSGKSLAVSGSVSSSMVLSASTNGTRAIMPANRSGRILATAPISRPPAESPRATIRPRAV